MRFAGIVDWSGWWVSPPTRVGPRARVYIKCTSWPRHRTASVRSVSPRIERAITSRWISLVPS